MFDLLRKIIVSNESFEMQASIVDDDTTTVSFAEYAKDDPVSTTEVYLSPEKLRECISGLVYLLARVEREGDSF